MDDDNDDENVGLHNPKHISPYHHTHYKKQGGNLDSEEEPKRRKWNNEF